MNYVGYHVALTRAQGERLSRIWSGRPNASKKDDPVPLSIVLKLYATRSGDYTPTRARG